MQNVSRVALSSRFSLASKHEKIVLISYIHNIKHINYLKVYFNILTFVGFNEFMCTVFYNCTASVPAYKLYILNNWLLKEHQNWTKLVYSKLQFSPDGEIERRKLPPI